MALPVLPHTWSDPQGSTGPARVLHGFGTATRAVQKPRRQVQDGFENFSQRRGISNRAAIPAALRKQGTFAAPYHNNLLSLQTRGREKDPK